MNFKRRVFYEKSPDALVKWNLKNYTELIKTFYKNQILEQNLKKGDKYSKTRFANKINYTAPINYHFNKWIAQFTPRATNFTDRWNCNSSDEFSLLFSVILENANRWLNFEPL